jgi:hypothetical protein
MRLRSRIIRIAEEARLALACPKLAPSAAAIFNSMKLKLKDSAAGK